MFQTRLHTFQYEIFSSDSETAGKLNDSTVYLKQQYNNLALEVN
ncbi:hypothetical protein SAMN05660841_02947 [Sphingobacterium nematocida]|uniref:Uncharacterized protein n=1 Tax=Sphingobacterium nematocida TaxID=1513896 RepID=A0A1T5F237_9SPHI|nr:hypothetical protein SAMN05660841_02947 [Sphingobacterium nematocida]